ncbi:RagB/SusD family nutrient uptake outer membrane protein [Membranicola marinus]|uniref:RagB/SusD family nutrient uptake outer membrane protein n=1 Tax=Membranihabitans marinus TaxID=1227546 RepID=A0A953HQY0_9BACT|nr:RagB/SusD family nutrient uptake outer membrane protein [Membranihabitans marinus]MBY5956755.1 RagB/SusD family nutrient uptake outer membrane protein [Membranihabitans marinus]
MKKLIVATIFIFGLFSCDLVEVPKAEVDKGPIFNTEQGLQMYTNSFYNQFPSSSKLSSSLNYYSAYNGVIQYLTPGGFGPEESSGWNWNSLRNINYFIANCTSEEVPVEVRNHYIGLARFFRAYFYFNKMRRFGDLPWIDHPLDVEDPLLTAGRDDRTLIMDKILEDLDFAINNISNKTDESASTVTSTVASALKSRICLWEGTFRKYHTEAGLSSSADQWLSEAVDAAEYVMDAGYTIYTGAGPEHSYKELFSSKKPISSEVLYAVTFDNGLGVAHQANRLWTSVTSSVAVGLTRSFVKTYLMRDGTPFTDIPGSDTMSFVTETQNRDYRLSQTVRTPGFTRLEGGQEIEVAPDYGYSLTGYQTHKFTMPDISLDNRMANENNIVLFRFAEVLLNYAEAKAELGELTDADWSRTIGVLRSRAGITGGLDSKPTTVDPYIQERFFPGISDPSLLEIRRERAIELSYEGFAWADVQRWKVGELLTDIWDGIYIPELDKPYDMNQDGKLDLVVTKKKDPEKIPGVYYLYVGETLDNGASNRYQLAADGHTLVFMKNQHRIWEDKLYFYPIPNLDLLKNPNLGQNPGW